MMADLLRQGRYADEAMVVLANEPVVAEAAGVPVTGPAISGSPS